MLDMSALLGGAAPTQKILEGAKHQVAHGKEAPKDKIKPDPALQESEKSL